MKLILFLQVMSLLDSERHILPIVFAKWDADRQQDYQEYLTSCAPVEINHGHRNTYVQPGAKAGQSAGATPYVVALAVLSVSYKPVGSYGRSPKCCLNNRENAVEYTLRRTL